MKATIKIDNKRKLKIDTSLRWFNIYRDNFGHDIFPDIVPLIDTVIKVGTDVFNEQEIDIDAVEEKIYALEWETVNQVIWALSKNADDSISDFEEWEAEQDKFPYDEILPKVFTTLADTYTTSKKYQPLKEMITARLLQWTKSLSQESTEG